MGWVIGALIYSAYLSGLGISPVAASRVWEGSVRVRRIRSRFIPGMAFVERGKWTMDGRSGSKIYPTR